MDANTRLNYSCKRCINRGVRRASFLRSVEAQVKAGLYRVLFAGPVVKVAETDAQQEEATHISHGCVVVNVDSLRNGMQYLEKIKRECLARGTQGFYSTALNSLK